MALGGFESRWERFVVLLATWLGVAVLFYFVYRFGSSAGEVPWPYVIAVGVVAGAGIGLYNGFRLRRQAASGQLAEGGVPGWRRTFAAAGIMVVAFLFTGLVPTAIGYCDTYLDAPGPYERCQSMVMGAILLFYAALFVFVVWLVSARQGEGSGDES